jgi:hypothetical protein
MTLDEALDWDTVAAALADSAPVWEPGTQHGYHALTFGWLVGEVVRRISAEMPLVAVDPNYTGEVAERWRFADGSGEIGVISSVTQAFCSTCTRARLSTEGKLFTCLFYDLRNDCILTLARVFHVPTNCRHCTCYVVFIIVLYQI